MSILERLKKISVNECGSLVTINSVLANDSVNLAARNNPYQSCPCPVFLAIRRMYVRTKAILESWWPYITPLCLFETSQKLQNRFFFSTNYRSICSWALGELINQCGESQVLYFLGGEYSPPLTSTLTAHSPPGK